VQGLVIIPSQLFFFGGGGVEMGLVIPFDRVSRIRISRCRPFILQFLVSFPSSFPSLGFQNLHLLECEFVYVGNEKKRSIAVLCYLPMLQFTSLLYVCSLTQ
jgi:hypothetical protein